MIKIKRLVPEFIITACLSQILALQIQGLAHPDKGENSSLSYRGSHYLFKLEGDGKNFPEAKRETRCTPCGHGQDDQRSPTNHLDPEYRGNGADNLGYDWSPMAWGGPAFSQGSRSQGKQQSLAWERGRGGRQMTGDWGRRPHAGVTGDDRFSCDRCRMFWEGGMDLANRFGDRSSFGRRMGHWQNDGRGYQNAVTTVTSPTIALRPEGRIAYVPSPGGEMYWDGVSGGGIRWDGFSNGISWLGGGNRQWGDPSWRDEPRNPGSYDQDPRKADNFSDRNKGPGYDRTWTSDSGGSSPWYNSGRTYPDANHNINFDIRNKGYAAKWHYGSTNQNGWNGNNMKWNYGGKDPYNRNGNRYGPGGSLGEKLDQEGNPLYYGEGSIQYGQGGSVYYDQGNYVFYYGHGGSSFNRPGPKYPQDGKSSPYPSSRPEYQYRPVSPGPQTARPWEYGANNRYDKGPNYPNTNWIRPGPTDTGYSRPTSHGKYPGSGYDDKIKPRPQRPGSADSGYRRPETGSGLNYGGTIYVTGSLIPGGYSYPAGSGSPHGYGDSRPNRYPSYGISSGGGEYPDGPNRYPGSSGDRYPSSIGYSPNPVSPSGYGDRNQGLGGFFSSPRPPSGYGDRNPNTGWYPPGSGSSTGYGSHNHGPDGHPQSPGPANGYGVHNQVPNRYPQNSGISSGYGDRTHGPVGYSSNHGISNEYGGNNRPGDSESSGRPDEIGYGHQNNYKGSSERPGGFVYYPRPGGPILSDSRPPPKGYYTGFITEIDSSSKHSSPDQGGYYLPGGSYPIRDKGSYPSHNDGHWIENKNRYPGGDYRYGTGGGDGHNDHPIGGYPFANNNPYFGSDRDRYSPHDKDRYPPPKDPFNGYGGNRFPDYHSGQDRFDPESQDRDRFPAGSSSGEHHKGPAANDEANSWNYGQDGHKDGIYRRAGGSYPPYHGGPYYTSSYLASASTPSISSQTLSEGKTKNVTQPDEVTQSTSQSV